MYYAKIIIQVLSFRVLNSERNISTCAMQATKSFLLAISRWCIHIFVRSRLRRGCHIFYVLGITINIHRSSLFDDVLYDGEGD